MPHDHDALQEKMRARILPEPSCTKDLIDGNRASVEGEVEFCRASDSDYVYARVIHVPEIRRIFSGLKLDASREQESQDNIRNHRGLRVRSHR